jgi:hypothetical protein
VDGTEDLRATPADRGLGRADTIAAGRSSILFEGFGDPLSFHSAPKVEPKEEIGWETEPGPLPRSWTSIGPRSAVDVSSRPAGRRTESRRQKIEVRSA